MAALGPTATGTLFRTAAYIFLAATISPISQLTLAPSHGAIPSSVNHATMIAVTFALGLTIGSRQSLLTPSRLDKMAAVFLFYVPALQYLLSGSSEHLGLVGSLILNGFLTCHVATILAAYETELSLRRFQLGRVSARTIGRFLLPAFVLAIYWTTERLLQQNRQTLSAGLTPVHLQLAHAITFSAMVPSWYLAVAIPGALHTAFFNPHANRRVLQAELAQLDWSLIDRAWSTTGYISVLENRAEEYRVMRCDHSLLGGEWQLTDRRRKHEGWKVNEPTYAVFEMLEAVRLVERRRPMVDSQATALVIGLGIGTAPKALISHGINTTIVELDPVVHEFATKYFALPANHTPIIENAVTWVAKQEQMESKGVPNVLYDYVIHDVFTGGASPLPLFNAEFLGNLRKLVRSDGVVALNYAGDFSLPLTRQILNTIEHVFNGRSQCRIFRDGPPPTRSHASPPTPPPASSPSFSRQHKTVRDASDNHYARRAEDKTAAQKQQHEADFLNMVVFCRNDADEGSIRFRQPTRADFLGSRSRQHYLLPKSEYEIPFPSTLGGAGSADAAGEGDPMSLDVLEAGSEQMWSKQQIESATRHWHIMRKIVPGAVWDLW